MNKVIFNDLVLLSGRILTGALMLPHGLRKYNKVMEGDYSFADPLHIGEKASLICVAGTEFIGSILLIAGLFTRLSAGSLLFTMFVAGVIHHWSDPFGDKELPLLYIVVYAFFVVWGGGKYSADYLVQMTRQRRNK